MTKKWHDSQKRTTPAAAAAAASSASLTPSQIKENVYAALRALLITEEEVQAHSAELETYITRLKETAGCPDFLKVLNNKPAFITVPNLMTIKMDFLTQCDITAKNPLYEKFFKSHAHAYTLTSILAILKQTVCEPAFTTLDALPNAISPDALLNPITQFYDAASTDQNMKAYHTLFCQLFTYYFVAELVRFQDQAEFFLVGSLSAEEIAADKEKEVTPSPFTLSKSDTLIAPVEGLFMVLPDQNPLFISLLGAATLHFSHQGVTQTMTTYGTQRAPEIYEAHPDGTLIFNDSLKVPMSALGFAAEEWHEVSQEVYATLQDCATQALKNTREKISALQTYLVRAESAATIERVSQKNNGAFLLTYQSIAKRLQPALTVAPRL